MTRHDRQRDASSHAEAIAAVVVTFQSERTIDACLQRLRQAADVAQIRVIDNASLDGTLAIVQRHALADPRLRFIANPDNPGFAVACNQGAAGSDSPWLGFVNPDCFVEADSLARLRAHAQRLGGNALVGADLVGEDGHRDAAAARRDPDFLRMLRSPAAADLGVARDPDCALQCVDAVSGALFVLPRTLFQRIGGFDPGYRLHAEDLDLCRRARDAGALVAVANDTRVVHVRGVSSRHDPGFVEWHKHRGLWRYFRKFEAPHRSGPQRMAVFAAIFMRLAAKLAAQAVKMR